MSGAAALSGLWHLRNTRRKDIAQIGSLLDPHRDLYTLRRSIRWAGMYAFVFNAILKMTAPVIVGGYSEYYPVLHM